MMSRAPVRHVGAAIFFSHPRLCRVCHVCRLPPCSSCAAERKRRARRRAQTQHRECRQRHRSMCVPFLHTRLQINRMDLARDAAADAADAEQEAGRCRMKPGLRAVHMSANAPHGNPAHRSAP
uniref:Uncharacterized protein n=1 Tax=Knipowitschia caucasica TaxID=637954 RepID=A0AAV2LCE9_KNICA